MNTIGSLLKSKRDANLSRIFNLICPSFKTDRPVTLPRETKPGGDPPASQTRAANRTLQIVQSLLLDRPAVLSHLLLSLWIHNYNKPLQQSLPVPYSTQMATRGRHATDHVTFQCCVWLVSSFPRTPFFIRPVCKPNKWHLWHFFPTNEGYLYFCMLISRWTASLNYWVKWMWSNRMLIIT